MGINFTNNEISYYLFQYWASSTGPCRTRRLQNLDSHSRDLRRTRKSQQSPMDNSISLLIWCGKAMSFSRIYLVGFAHGGVSVVSSPPCAVRSWDIQSVADGHQGGDGDEVLDVIHFSLLVAVNAPFSNDDTSAWTIRFLYSLSALIRRPRSKYCCWFSDYQLLWIDDGLFLLLYGMVKLWGCGFFWKMKVGRYVHV